VIFKKDIYTFDYKGAVEAIQFQNQLHIVQALLGNLIIQQIGHKIGEDAFSTRDSKRRFYHDQNLINKSTKKLERVDLNEPSTGNSVKIKLLRVSTGGDKLFPIKD